MIDAFGRNNQGTLHSSGMVGLFVGYTKQTMIQVDLKVQWFISIPRIDTSSSGIVVNHKTCNGPPKSAGRRARPDDSETSERKVMR